MLLFILPDISAHNQHGGNIVVLFFAVLKPNLYTDVLIDTIKICCTVVIAAIVNWWSTRYFPAILKDQIQICRLLGLLGLIIWVNLLLQFSKIEGIYHSEIILDYLFASIPQSTSWTVESDWFALQQVYVSDWAQIDKILKCVEGKAKSFNLKVEPFDVLLPVIKPNKSIWQINLVNFLLCLLFLGYGFNSFGFLEEVMVEVTFKHQVVVIQFFELFDQVFLFDDEIYHLLSHN